MRESDPMVDGKEAADVAALVICSICLEAVAGNKGRSTAKLHCNHEFHLDCIGSAFNVKGQMQCPNCRKVEKGQWLFANGARLCTEFNMEDWAHDEDLYDPSYAEIPLGLQWCPFNGFNRLPSLFEEGELSSNAYHDPMGHHAFFAEHTATPSSGHSCPYVAYFLQPSSSNSSESIADGPSFGHHWSGLSGPSEISTSHAFAAVDLHYHSWDPHPPSFASGTDQASAPPATVRSVRGDSDGIPRSGSFGPPFVFSHGSGPRTGNSFMSPMVPPIPSNISRTHERVGVHAYHHLPPNSNGMRSPVFPNGSRRSGAPRGLPSAGPVPSSSDNGYAVYPPSGSSARNHQEGEAARNRFYAWERDRFAPFPLVPVDRESGWWGPFHQGSSGSESNNRSSSYWHRHGSERTAASQSRPESSSYQPVNPPARLHPFI